MNINLTIVSQRVRTLPDILFNQGNYAVLEGSVVWLYCEIDLSSPSLTLSWNKDRILLVQDVPHIRIRTTTSANVISVFLIVDSFQASFSDGGIYQCVAEDDGTAEVGRSLTLTGSYDKLYYMMLHTLFYCPPEGVNF